MDYAIKRGEFSWALEHLKDGRRVTRAGWNGKGMYIALHTPTADEAMTESYVYIKNAQDGLTPWICTQGDLLADDWELAK